MHLGSIGWSEREHNQRKGTVCAAVSLARSTLAPAGAVESFASPVRRSAPEARRPARRPSCGDSGVGVQQGRRCNRISRPAGGAAKASHAGARPNDTTRSAAGYGLLVSDLSPCLPNMKLIVRTRTGVLLFHLALLHILHFLDADVLSPMSGNFRL